MYYSVLLVIHIKPILQRLNISLPCFFQHRQHQFPVVSHDRDSIQGSHAHVGEAAFELGEAFEGAAAGAAGAGHEDAALVAEEMVFGGVTAA